MKSFKDHQSESRALTIKLSDVVEPSVLEEANRKELVSMTDSSKKKLSSDQDIRSKLVDVNKNGVVSMKTSSGTSPTNEKPHKQKIQMLEFKDTYLNGDKKIAKKKRLNQCMKGDIKVSCTCESFLYHGYAYILSEMDAKYGKKETRPPKRNNPDETGSLCKHLYNALSSTFPFATNQLVSMLNKKGIE